MNIDLELARRYMAMIADGKNPVTKEYVTAADTVFDTRVQAVCDFIMTELDKLIAQEETDCQVFTPPPSPYPITMRELVRILNSTVASRSNTVKYTTRKIEKWLESIGALRRIKLDGVTYKKKTHGSGALCATLSRFKIGSIINVGVYIDFWYIR